MNTKVYPLLLKKTCTEIWLVRKIVPEVILLEMGKIYPGGSVHGIQRMLPISELGHFQNPVWAKGLSYLLLTLFSYPHLRLTHFLSLIPITDNDDNDSLRIRNISWGQRNGWGRALELMRKETIHQIWCTLVSRQSYAHVTVKRQACWLVDNSLLFACQSIHKQSLVFVVLGF